MCEHLVEFMMSESVIDGVRNGEIEELIHVQAGRLLHMPTVPSLSHEKPMSGARSFRRRGKRMVLGNPRIAAS